DTALLEDVKDLQPSITDTLHHETIGHL
ncbi:uncharacterized, partial [Tachysurus ichikawai]